MVQAAEPGQGAFDAQAEAGVGDGAVAAEVEVPFVRLRVQLFFLHLGEKDVEVVFALREADDFAEAAVEEEVGEKGAGSGVFNGRVRPSVLAVGPLVSVSSPGPILPRYGVASARRRRVPRAPPSA